MTKKELQQYLKDRGVESKIDIAQPWILWRAKTSSITLKELAKIIEENDIYENSDDD
jgi:hypothetical protein